MPAPMVTNAQLAAMVFDTVSYHVEATGSPTTWALLDGQLPPGLAIDISSGVIGGIIQATGVGQFSAVIAATNGSGTGTAEIAWTVNPVNATLALKAIPPALSPAGSFITRIVPVKPSALTPVAPLSLPAPVLSGQTEAQTITLSWRPIFQAASYDIYRGVLSGGETWVATVNSPGYVDTGLRGNTTYYYKVTAANIIVTSPFSNEVAEQTEAYVRPNPITFPSLRWYFPLDRKSEIFGLNHFDSIAGTGTTSGNGFMAADVASGSLALVSGEYDWAQSGASFRLDVSGVGGALGAFPTGQWTETFGGWFRTAIGGTITVFNRLQGGGVAGQFRLQCVAGVISAYGYTGYGTPGYWFDAEGSPPYPATPVGAYPNDGEWHHIFATLTNDTTAAAGGLLTVYVDGIAQTPVQGRVGAYFSRDQLYAFAGDSESAMSDLFLCDADATTAVLDYLVTSGLTI